jgi:hypothetical protein
MARSTAGIGLGDELALPCVAAGLRIEWGGRIGSYWGKTRTFAELLIDREEDRTPAEPSRSCTPPNLRR